MYGEQLAEARSAQCVSHATEQQVGSKSHTDVQHVADEQPGVACGTLHGSVALAQGLPESSVIVSVTVPTSVGATPETRM